jgi:hypothetical protein
MDRSRSSPRAARADAEAIRVDAGASLSHDGLARRVAPALPLGWNRVLGAAHSHDALQKPGNAGCEAGPFAWGTGPGMG